MVCGMSTQCKDQCQHARCLECMCKFSAVCKPNHHQQVLEAALERLGAKPIVHRMNPKAMPRQQLLGSLNLDTREWTDGVLTAAARKVSNRNCQALSVDRHGVQACYDYFVLAAGTVLPKVCCGMHCMAAWTQVPTACHDGTWGCCIT